MNDTEFPWMLLAGLFGFVGLIVALAVPMFSTSGEKPTVTPSPLPQPSQTVSTHGVAPVAALPATEAPEGVALLLTFMGVLAILAGGFGFSVAETSIHQNTFTLIGLGGAIFFAAGAVVTELQRIKKQLQADAARLAANNPQP